MNCKRWPGLQKPAIGTVPQLNDLHRIGRRIVPVLAMAIALLVLPVPRAGAGAVGLWDMRGHWAEKDVLLLLQEGIISGYPDQSFRPEQGLSRAEFVCLMNRSFGLDEMVDSGMTQLEADKWYARDVAIAVQAGYLVGYEDGSLRTEALISRQEAAVILAGLLQLNVQNGHFADIRDIRDIRGIRDIAEIAPWSRSAIIALLSAGYIHGYEDGTFRPAAIMTRAEVAVILAKKIRLEEETAVEAIASPAAQPQAAPPSSTSSGHSSHQTSTPLARQALLTMITRAQSRLGQVTAGAQPGQFPHQAMTPLQTAINQATHINETATSQSEIDQAFSSLRQALQTFNEQEIAPGGDSNILRGVFEVSQ